MKNKFMSCMLFCFGITAMSMAQTQELSGFKHLSSHTISPIFEGKEVKGYTVFYKADKADRKNDNYGLSVYDENLKEIKTITLQKPRSQYYLIGNGYDGNVIAFYFYNYKADQYEMECYDKGLVKKGEQTVEHKLTNVEKASLQQKINSDEKDGEGGMGYDISLHPVPGKGFVANGLLKNGKGFTLDMYDDKLHAKWHYTTDEESKEYETFIINEVNDKYILGNLVKRPGLMSKKMTFYITAFDVTKGKKLMEIPVESDEHEQLSLNTVTYDENSDQFFAIGDYYAENDKPGVAKSRGFYIKSFSTDGKITNKKFYSWDKDVKSMLPPEADESLKKGAMNYTHKILKGGDGKIYLVCEQFSKSADAAGIALNVLGGGYGNSMTKASVWNMLIYVLNPDFTLTAIKLYPKDKSNVTLPPGADFYGSGMIGMITKYVGGFDYQFTQMTNDGKSFDVVYVNYDKEKGESTKRIVGNILIAPDGKFSLDKIDITSRATASFLYPAKPGYLMMVDFLKKEKTVGMKLVKLNY